MRWAHGDRLPSIKTVMDRYRILNRMVDRNRTKMWAAGSPCTYWRNVSVDKMGALVQNQTKCYCWATPAGGDSQQSAPDRKHFLCMGTGMLSGYQKYGYHEIALSTPSNLTKSSPNLVISGDRGSSYILSGTTLAETLTTERLALTRFKDVTFFLANESTDKDQNRIEYEYSTDDITWTTIVMTDYVSPLANKQGALSLPANTEYIRFRVRLKKRVATATSPKWNSIRFRYRNHVMIKEMDPRFNLAMPAFLAAREQQSRYIEQGEYGWITKFPVEWWTLPDADILNTDIITFLQGTYSGYKFQVKNLREFAYGENLQILHKGFESSLIRDKNELLGIIHYLM